MQKLVIVLQLVNFLLSTAVSAASLAVLLQLVRLLGSKGRSRIRTVVQALVNGAEAAKEKA